MYNISETRSYKVNSTSSSCVYTGSGDWNIQCSDSCELTTNVDLGSNVLRFNGTGVIKVYANITGISSRLNQNNCTVIRYNNSRFS